MRARVLPLLRASVLVSGLVSVLYGLVGCAASCPVIPGPEREAFLAVKPEEGYVLNPGDQISIEVYQNAQMTRSVTIRPDGQVTLPLVNDVAAAGLSVAQFQARLTERLKSFLRDPVVSISVTSFSEKRIYLQGEVRQAAAFTYRGDMYLLQAVALSGGMTALAEGCAVIVRQKGTEFLRYAVMLEPLITGEDMKQNIALQPNDVITIR